MGDQSGPDRTISLKEGSPEKATDQCSQKEHQVESPDMNARIDEARNEISPDLPKAFREALLNKTSPEDLLCGSNP
jgi:hypothetical protein